MDDAAAAGAVGIPFYLFFSFYWSVFFFYWSVFLFRMDAASLINEAKKNIKNKLMMIKELGWRQLFGSNLNAWNDLLARMEGIVLGQDPDAFYWNLTPSGKFSVKSHYVALMLRNTPNMNKDLWNLKVPLKIKIFLWFLRRGVILTKDNLAKRS